jgi:hypothetical protein
MNRNTAATVFAILFLVAASAACSPQASTPADVPLISLAPTAFANPAALGSGEPNLSPGSNDRFHLSWIESSEDLRTVRVASFAVDGSAWSAPATVASAASIFANWADFPSVIELGDGTLVAHWLQYLATGKYAYGVQMARTGADGTWGEPWQPHEDASPVEHGFVSVVAADDGGFTAIWLDGRAFAAAAAEGATGAGADMSVRSRRYDSAGTPGPEEALDLRTCDCCQTGAAQLGSALVVAYRDRSPDEVRDIYTVRRTDEGWSEPQPVANDGWMIPGCPVNGPVVVSTGGESGAVVWFALVDGSPEVKIAFTDDAGATFGIPILIEKGDAVAQTLGRVGLTSLGDGAVLATWLTQVGDVGEIRYQRYTSGGATGPVGLLATTGAARSSGFPRVAANGDYVAFAWTDTLGDAPEIRTATIAAAALR